VEIGDLLIVEELLTARPQFSHQRLAITVYTLRFAILRGDVEMFQYFVQHPASNDERMHLQPWILLEAAAFHGNPSTFQALLKYGLNIHQTNDSGKGSALAAAAASNHLDLVRQLHGLGAGVCTVAVGRSDKHYEPELRPLYLLASIEGMSAIHGAVKTQNIEMVDFLISNGADVNQCYNIPGWRERVLPVFPVQIATHHGNELLVRKLLDADADANSVAGIPRKHTTESLSLESIVGRPSIRIALERGEESIADLLLNRGARMPTTSTGNQTWNPLTSAIQGRNHRLFRRVLQAFGAYHPIAGEALADYISAYGCSSGADLIGSGFIAPNEIHCPEVLCVAVERGDTVFVHTLLNDAKARLGKLPPRYGAAGFAFAAWLGKNDMFPIYLDAGVRPHEEPIYRDLQSAVSEAIRHSYYQRKEGFEAELLEQGIEQLIEACNPPDGNPGEHEKWRASIFDSCRDAIVYGRLDVLERLVSYVVDIDWAPDDEGTLFQHAIAQTVTDMAVYLLDLGANPDPQRGSRLLHNAPIQQAAEHSSELLERLIRANVDIDTKLKIWRGATALQRAAAAGNFQSVKMLLKAGANVNGLAGKFDGRTAIEGAAEHGRLDMVLYLLEAGADIKGRTNRNYRRTVYRAWKEGHRTVVRMIQDWKREKYGHEDCEDVEVILESMTYDELAFESAASIVEAEKWAREHAEEVLDDIEHEQRVFNRRRARLGL
jgi:ankyrin repeat protein